MSDGSLIFDTKIDSSGAGRDIAKLKVKLEKAVNSVGKQANLVAKLESQLKDLQNAQAPTEEYARLEQAFQKADTRLQGLIDRQDKFLATGGTTSGAAWERLQYDIEKTAAEVREYQAQMEAMKAGGSAFTKDSAAVSDLSVKLDTAKIKLEELTLKEQEAAAALRKASIPAVSALDSASVAMNRFSKRIANTIKSALVFSLLYKGLSTLRTYMGNALKTNAEFTASLAQLKGALLTAFQPVFSAAIPALITLLNVLTAVISAIARFFALLSGKGLSVMSKSAEAMNSEANAISGAGGAAKEASKSMADFDEINQLQDNSGGGGGGGAGGGDGIAPSFEGLEEAAEKFELIRDLVLAILAGLLAWKIASAFTTSLSMIAGIAMIVAGAFLLIKGYWDAWKNGIDTTNLIEVFTGLALVVGGIALAFGATTAAIALLVGGIALLVLGIKDMIENGVNLQNTLMVIGGILALGIGIALLVGSWIPLLIAAVVALITFIVLRWDEVKQFFIDLWEKIKEVFALAWEFIKAVWEVVATWFSENVIEPIKEFFSPLTEWFSTFFEGLWLIVEAIWVIVAGWFNETVVQPIIEFFRPIITSVGGFFSQLWEDIKLIWQKVSAWFEEYVTKPITLAWETAIGGLQTFAKGIFNGIIGFFESVVNWIIGALNSFMSGFNAIATAAGEIVGKDFSGFGQISKISIPRLAQGAVIPPNREFLALLGDQKSGTNIEAPLDTIVAAFRQVMRESSGGKGEAVMEVDGQAFGRLVYRYGNAESKRIGVRLVGV